ncbi:uncharacterized protein LOC129899009 isoform X3 [Solanum dulcamara]|uniref:uncharacterized protein LOC129899009 isoform X3 n=1 Tax=Solanum dulcamara TaxID=45834 RepID=UPI00248500E7|nr:uncharacterized protein LOC129899009 isoform X3 [Solanum dulcamara]
MFSIGCKLMQLEISKTGISMVSSSSGSVSTSHMSSGNIFDVKTTKDGKTTRVSRFPGYQSYADPANFNDGSSSAPTPNSTSETPNVRKRKHSSMKE